MELPRVLTRNNLNRIMNLKYFLSGYYCTNERQDHINYYLPYDLKCIYKELWGKLLFSKIVDISWKAQTSFLLSTQKSNVLYKAWFFESYISSTRNSTVCSERTHFTLEAYTHCGYQFLRTRCFSFYVYVLILYVPTTKHKHMNSYFPFKCVSRSFIGALRALAHSIG